MSSRTAPGVIAISPAQVKAPIALPSKQKDPINVRRAVGGDCEVLQALLSEPEIVYWTIEMPFTTAASVQQRITEKNDGNYVLVACSGSNVIGTVSLTSYPSPRMRHVAKLGTMAVNPAAQGKGAGSALMAAAINLADQWLNVSRLELMVYADNVPAIGLYRKYGFEQEGLLRNMAFRQGQYVDITVMSRLRRG